MENKTIVLKDTNGNSLYTSSVINITYNELKTLKSSNKLVPGMKYRITDYSTVIDTNNYIKSANHQFDIVVVATSTSNLNEWAMAVHHSGDTYFSKCKLDAWKLLYSLDNDINKFGWASTKGKGVIYRMIDEFGNDCPYDFKNIQFKRFKITAFTNCTSLVSSTNYYYGIRYIFNNTDGYPQEATIDTYNTTDFQWCYTFNAHKVKTEVSTPSIVTANIDATLAVYDSDIANYAGFIPCHDNIIKPFYGSTSNAYNHKQLLNNIVIFGTFGQGAQSIEGKSVAVSQLPTNNSFGTECYNMTFGTGCKDNIVGKSCSGNVFANNCQGNVLGRGCNNNSFASNALNNKFGNLINNVIIKNNQSYYNQIGSNCKYLDITGSDIIVYPYVQGSNTSRLSVSNQSSGTMFAGINSSKALVTYKLENIINS